MPDTDWSRPVRRDCDKMFPPRHRGSGLPRALAPSPAKAGEGWGGVLLGSTRTVRSEEHTSELQSLMRISYAVFCLKKKKIHTKQLESRLVYCYTNMQFN